MADGASDPGPWLRRIGHVGPRAPTLATFRGIGFRTADQIAAKLGIEKTALIRVRAGIAYALTEAMDEGHCGLPAEELISLGQTLLEVPAELVDTALGLELEGGAVIADDLEDRRCVFLAALYEPSAKSPRS